MQRRTFVKGAALTSLAAITTPGIYAQNKTPVPKPDKRKILEGNEFFLDIGYTPVNLTGNSAIATTINGQIPGPTLVWQEGEEVTIHVTNRLPHTSSIHWHGIILPTEMDGVPGISYKGIAPGKTFTYRFKVAQHGTYWYHSHSGFQEQTGMYGSIVIKPKTKEPFDYDRDYVILLSDWSDEKPTSIYRKLKISSDYYNFSQRTVGDFFREVQQKGFLNAFNDRKMWNEMRMTYRDISDVSGYTYTFLMNGQPPEESFKALFQKGEKVRLRFINAAAMTFFDVRIPGLKMRIVAADGNHVQPVTVDEFRIGVAETYDIIVEPDAEKAYAVFAQSIDRSGYALGTLTHDQNLTASTPEMDPFPLLSMTDMGMRMKMKGKKESKGMKCGSGMNMGNAQTGNIKFVEMEKQKYPVTKLPMKHGVG